MEVLSLLLSILLTLNLFKNCHAEDRARIVAAKKVHNLYLVEGKDIVISYSLHNIGSAAALNVQLVDNTFGLNDFDIVGGQLQVKIDRIPPGANVTHNVVVRPKKFGFFNFTSAELTYQPVEDSTELQTAFTSEPGQGTIIAIRDYNKKFSPHFFDWLIFALLLVPTLVVPFSMWNNIQKKYELNSKRIKRS